MPHNPKSCCVPHGQRTGQWILETRSLPWDDVLA
jgi:hypothetical protein